MARKAQTKKTPRRTHQRKAGAPKKNGKIPAANRVALETGLVGNVLVFLAGNGGDIAKQLTAAIQSSPSIWVDEREVARVRAEQAAQAQLPPPDPE